MLAKTSHTYFDTYALTAKVPGPHVLIMAGVHGDELEPIIAAMKLTQKLQRTLTKGKVTILPVANGSALALGHRCGKDKLDLARTLPGKKTGSYTQRLAYAISQLIQTADYLIDLHTGGTLFDILPLCGYMLHPCKKVLEQQQQMAHAFGMPIIWGTDAQAQGRTLSVARDLYIPAIYAECGGGLAIKETTIHLYEQGCINVLDHLGLTTKAEKQKKKTFTWLEDYTPGQGHLQMKLPAPEAGIFAPAVAIGKKVKKGSPLGYIINPLLNKRTKITATEEGLLFMLRISAKVDIGDSLGGILPIRGKGKKVIYEQ